MLEIIEKKEQERIQQFKEWGYLLINLTRDSTDEVYRQFHPSYPHGDVPFPEFPGYTAQSVEGIWEGLKMFITTGIDPSRFECTDPNKLSRTEAYYGTYIGHRYGSNIVLTEEEAFEKIYKPLYSWQILVKMKKEFEILKNLYTTRQMVWIVDNIYDEHILLLMSYL